MSKAPTSPTTPPTAESVRMWLQSTGFPLEMRTAAAFRQQSFEVTQSFMFPDPDENKGRELDVMAMDLRSDGRAQVRWVVECKATSQPWVVLKAAQTNEVHGRLPRFISVSPGMREAMAGQTGIGRDIVKAYRYPGYGIKAQAEKNVDRNSDKGTERDLAYSSSWQVAKACASVMPGHLPGGLEVPTAAIPVIVTSSPLFECELNGEGNLEVAPVVVSAFDFAIVHREFACTVLLVNDTYLDQFVLLARKCTDQILDPFERASKPGK